MKPKKVDTSNSNLLSIQIYAAGKRPGFLKTLMAIFFEFSKANSLGYRLASRNIRARYRQSIFGIFWALLPPIGNAAIWIVLNKSNIITMSGSGNNYPVFVLTGTTLWSVFSIAVLMPIQIVQNNTNILTKINFPREALIYTAIYEIGFSTAIALLIIVSEFIFFNIPIHASTLLFIPGLALLIMTGLAISLLILQISILYKDVQFALPSTLQFGMYLSPVVYYAHTLQGMAKILNYNPLTYIITFTRSHLLGQDSTVSISLFFAIFIVTLIIFIVGLVIQRMTAEILIERMGS